MEGMKLLAPLFLAFAVGCTVGEARPAEPSPEALPEEQRPAPPPAAGPEAEARAAAGVERAAAAYAVGEVTRALSLSQQVLADYPSTGAANQALWVAARSAFALGQYEEARRLAERFAALHPTGSEAAREARSLASLAADAQARPVSGVLVGAILPRTGPDVLVQYGDLVLEGIRLAVRQAEQRQGRSIELVVADDGGGSRTAAALGELERRGVAAVIGPLLPQQLFAVGAARSNPALLLVSPTIPELPADLRNVYTVGGGDTRGAVELARYAARLGMREGAILHARGPEHERRARAFAAEFQARGGRILTTVPYDSGTTTYASEMRRILSAVGPAQRDRRPFALFVAAPDRDVPQIAPQISFYGLDGVGAQVLGDAIWASDAVRRLVPVRDLEGVVAAASLPADRAAGVADPEFIELFEQAYRRSLGNVLPALGYDAAHLVLQALPNQSVTPEAVTRRFELLAEVRAATGTLSVRDARLVRTPHLVVIRNGRLEPAPDPLLGPAAPAGVGADPHPATGSVRP
jgi:ABC-type branched-subunit amino acid transport system substrate-binding protein